MGKDDDSRDTSSSSSDEELEKEEDEQSWVQCDKCTKWRRLPPEVAAQLNDEAEWWE